jgi:hypothetical protein
MGRLRAETAILGAGAGLGIDDGAQRKGVPAVSQFQLQGLGHQRSGGAGRDMFFANGWFRHIRQPWQKFST